MMLPLQPFVPPPEQRILIHYDFVYFQDNSLLLPSGEPVPEIILSIAVDVQPGNESRVFRAWKHASVPSKSLLERAIAGEPEMLRTFAEWMIPYPNFTFVHWDMKGDRFGFDHLRERAKGTGIELPIPPNCFDLCAQLWNWFGRDPFPIHPRLEMAIRANASSTKDLLSKRECREAIQTGELEKVAANTERRVKGIRDILDRVIDRTYRTSPIGVRPPLVEGNAHRDGPAGGNSFWWKGRCSEIPTGNLYILLAALWSEESLTFQDARNYHLHDENHHRQLAAYVTKTLKNLRIPFRVSIEKKSRFRLKSTESCEVKD